MLSTSLAFLLAVVLVPLLIVVIPVMNKIEDKQANPETALTWEKVKKQLPVWRTNALSTLNSVREHLSRLLQRGRVLAIATWQRLSYEVERRFGSATEGTRRIPDAQESTETNQES